MYREIVGRVQVELCIPDGSTALEVLELLQKTYSGIPDKTSMLIAINSEYIDPSTSLNNNDEVAFIPPVSGGS